ncbi:hypothetical protein C8R43DRAFT_970718 [Mycena crocata]|nr:hypothetical protein C8R43DRAFT_970718 [Mycena crocata]
MATQPMGEARGVAVNQQLSWDDTLNRIISLSDVTRQRNAFLEARVDELEMELGMWRRAHTVAIEASERDVKAHQRQVSTLNRQISQRDLFANQDPLILCVINADTTLFNRSFLVQGQEGGMAAAQRLTQAIAARLATENLLIFGRLSFWVSLYFNKREVLERLVVNNICSAQQFDTFLAGFSQCSPRFSLVDVSYGMDGTDIKIKEYMQTYARFPQTLRIFLAGGHEPQYSSTFDALESEHILGKLIILESDRDVHPITMSLPVLRVDGLFMNQQLPQIGQKPSPLSAGCLNTNGGLISPQSPVSNISGRIIDPALPLHKQNPPPCNEHYLMTCSKGPAVCKYSHEYILTQEQLACLSSNAKKAPCNWLKNGLPCPYGDQCCWGHVCPNGPKCYHLSRSKCWFKGEAMHPQLQDGPGDCKKNPPDLRDSASTF